MKTSGRMSCEQFEHCGELLLYKIDGSLKYPSQATPEQEWKAKLAFPIPKIFAR